MSPQKVKQVIDYFLLQAQRKVPITSSSVETTFYHENVNLTMHTHA